MTSKQAHESPPQPGSEPRSEPGSELPDLWPDSGKRHSPGSTTYSPPEQAPVFVQVAVPTPVARLFDYRWPADAPPPVPGARVMVPFARRQLIGLVVSISSESTLAPGRIKSVGQVIDSSAVLAPDMLSLLIWAASYYHHPIGEVLVAALPRVLRQGAPAAIEQREIFTLEQSLDTLLPTLGRAPVQRRLVERLAASESVDATVLSTISARWRASLAPLIERSAVSVSLSRSLPLNTAQDTGPALVGEQAAALEAIVDALGQQRTFLLNGVTGSGKTEVYLQAIEAARSRGEQTLVLVPEISLTPQLMGRFAARLSGCLVSLHSGLNDTERSQAWLLASEGHADVVVGTRSAVLVPLPRLGLLIVDEEHDASLKQQDGFRYHARDLALMRGRDATCPVVLGSATPSFESLQNVASERFVELRLTARATGAPPPVLALVDIRQRALAEGLSERLLDAIAEHLEAGGQALVFINRRGFAPTLLCNDCGAAADCQRCDAHMTVHAASGRLRCHHCGAERATPNACEGCGSVQLDRVGHGTERVAAALAEAFPDVEIARIDRDSTRKKGALEEQLDRAISGRARLLVGTQMLAKGHHFPALTLVGILDADRGLFGTDFRSLEQMGQLILQVAGRAGRESAQGMVMIQTRNPDNPMLQTLVAEGYDAFAEVAMQERRIAGWPPFGHVALLRSEAVDSRLPVAFLDTVADFLTKDLESRDALGDVELLGPAPAPMERLAGRYRARLLVLSESRAKLHTTLARLASVIDALDGARQVRWSIDVDPADLF